MFYPLRLFLRILLTFLRPVFCRTSHNLVCNNFAIYKKLAKVLEVGKFSSYVTVSTFFLSDKTFYRKANIGKHGVTNIKAHDWYKSYGKPFLV